MKRYEIEYVNDKIRRLKENDLMLDDIRNETIETMLKYVSAREIGFISTDEFMRLISRA